MQLIVLRRVVMVLTLLALVPVAAWAQEATLSGTVTDSSTTSELAPR